MTDDSTKPTSYPSPVDQLLSIEPPRMLGAPWPDYRALGLSTEHEPDLIRMSVDETLHRAPRTSTRVWAPVHAWRALGQLRAVSAVAPLLELLDDEGADDWMSEELPSVFAMIGSDVLPDLIRFLHDPAREPWARIAVIRALKDIALAEADRYGEVVAALSRALSKWYRNDEVLNAFLISYLVDLEAVEAAPLMEEAFRGDRVDISVHGDWEDIQLDLGLISERVTPRPDYGPGLRRVPVSPSVAAVPKARKSNGKSKRKAARAARKRNRRRM